MTKNELNKFKNILEAKQAELVAFVRNREGIAIEKSPDALDEVQHAAERELAIRNLDRESQRVCKRERPSERCFLDVFHDEVIRTNVMERADVRMIECGGCFCFTPEPFECGAVVGQMGHSGRNAGQFHWVHQIVSDSQGNLYTGEVDTGKRIQKFALQH